MKLFGDIQLWYCNSIFT